MGVGPMVDVGVFVSVDVVVKDGVDEDVLVEDGVIVGVFDVVAVGVSVAVGGVNNG